MATEMQKRAFEIRLQKLKEGKPIRMGQVMREAGYSPKSAINPHLLLNSKGWKELLASIDEKPLLDRLKEIALSKKDKRASIEAIKELLKLKDRYPKEKLKVELFEEELKKIKDENG
jgi:hypothetical protein